MAQKLPQNSLSLIPQADPARVARLNCESEQWLARYLQASAARKWLARFEAYAKS